MLTSYNFAINKVTGTTFTVNGKMFRWVEDKDTGTGTTKTISRVHAPTLDDAIIFVLSLNIKVA